jgi:AcrR family transcriptional regulator
MMPLAQTNRSDLRGFILGVCRAIVSELGEDGLTMRNIAARAGVSSTILYRHFDGKAALLRELQLDGYARLDERLAAVVASTDDPVERLFGECVNYVEFARTNPWLYALSFQDVRIEGEALTEPGHDNPFVVRVADCLASAGWLRCELDASAAAAQLWAAMHGLSCALLSGALRSGSAPIGDVDEREFVESYVRTLMRGLSSRSRAEGVGAQIETSSAVSAADASRA